MDRHPFGLLGLAANPHPRTFGCGRRWAGGVDEVPWRPGRWVCGLDPAAGEQERCLPDKRHERPMHVVIQALNPIALFSVSVLKASTATRD